MKTFNALFKYHFITYLKTNKFVIPMIVWVTIMCISYSVKPVGVVSSFVITAMCLFFIMLWITFSYMDGIDEVAEQLIILKTRKQSIYYLSKNIFLMLIGLFMSIMGVLLPIVGNFVNMFSLFNRELVMWDIFSALIIHVVFAILGCSLGTLFQPRCIKNRKIAIELAIFIAVISLVKVGIMQKVPEVKYIDWILPPTGEIQDCFNNKDIFYLSDIVKSMLYGIIYSFVLNIINIEMLKRKLF
ncbi:MULTISPECIES: hypothetical protein [Clostridium]|uniref:ABC-2 family transporter protein n=1 Tax=Clostridium cibarium TaxID=2762247 RepID=A0ABR8PUT8_9CLOT|nr:MULTISPECIES: hypothetical protein [Clostridium]MBD7911927.1 hypothetical protein [Clostridium cibarium]